MVVAEATEPTPEELRNARAYLDSLGLGPLYAAWEKYLRSGYDKPEIILQMISTDKEYKEAFDARFPAIAAIRAENAARARRGEPLRYEPTPLDYVNLEVGYREELRRLGPVGERMATNENFTKWIMGEVSQGEVAERLNIAENYLYADMNAGVREQLRSIYGLSDAEMIQYVMSDSKEQAQLEAQFASNMRRANVTAAANLAGLDVTNKMLTEIASSPNSQASTYEGARLQFSNIADQADSWRTMASISGESLTDDELAADAFGTSGSAAASKKKKRLASQERARYSKSSGLSRGSLSSGGLGSQ